MDNVPRGCIEEHVLAVPVTQAHDVPHLPKIHRRSEAALTERSPGAPQSSHLVNYRTTDLSHSITRARAIEVYGTTAFTLAE